MKRNSNIFIGTVIALLIVIGGGTILANHFSAAREKDSNNIPLANIPEPVGDNKVLPAQVLIPGVPFSSQAPFGEWSDPRQQDGCEEASVMMAAKWVKGEGIASKTAAKNEILALSHKAEEMFGVYQDSSSKDTLKLMQEFYGYKGGKVINDVQTQDIQEALADGMIVIVPADGRKLNNPNFSGGGPDRHALVIIGYDDKAGVFITQDPGTRQGAMYKYSYQILMGALRDYPTGDHEEHFNLSTAAILINKV